MAALVAITCESLPGVWRRLAFPRQWAEAFRSLRAPPEVSGAASRLGTNRGGRAAAFFAAQHNSRRPANISKPAQLETFHNFCFPRKIPRGLTSALIF